MALGVRENAPEKYEWVFQHRTLGRFGIFSIPGKPSSEMAASSIVFPIKPYVSVF